MKALMYTAPKTLEIVAIPRPMVGEGDVLIKILASCICGSDVHGWFGTNGRRFPPMIMGHEFSGRVEELGSKVENLKLGDIVTVQPCLSCFSCPTCQSGMNQNCPEKKVLGVFDNNGGMQEYIAVPAKYCFTLPEGMDYRLGSLVEAFAVSYAALKKAGDLKGKRVLIIGAGAIGLFALMAAKMQDPKQIVMSDLSEDRLKIAKELGATDVINPSKMDYETSIETVFGGLKADVTIEAVGIEITANQAVDATAPGGLSIWIGNNQKKITVDMQDIVTKEIAIKGTYIYTHKEFGEAVTLLSKLDVDLFLSHCIEIPLEEAADMFATLGDEPETCLRSIIVFEP